MLANNTIPTRTWLSKNRFMAFLFAEIFRRASWDTEKTGRSSKPAPAGIKNAKRRASDSHAEAAKRKEIQGFGISA
jgi:hypothetical protein